MLIKESEAYIMSMKNCCSNDAEQCSNVKVTVEVSKIVKYLSIAAILIVGIIFGTKTFHKMLEGGFFNETQ